MATIAELLMEKGRVAREARMARTAAWMPLVDQLANLPNQIRADRAAQAQATQKAYDAQQERALRQQQLAQGQQRLDQGQVEIDAKQRDSEKQQALAELLGEPGVIRDDGTLDQKLLVDTVNSRGRRDLLPDLVAIRDRWDESAAKRLKAQADAEEADRRNRTAVTQEGARRTIGDEIASGPMTPDRARQLQGRAFREGLTLPQGIAPEPEKLTFGAPQPYMVGGRRTLLRPRSDGALVNLQGAVVQDAQPDVAPQQPKDERIVQIMGPNGTPIWVRESQAINQPAAQAPRAVTGQERGVLAFYNRAKDAVETLTTPDQSGASLEQKMATQGLARQGQLQYAPNVLQSTDQQRYRQAQRAFTEARLRKESGAAIPTSEYENDAKTYFAQPGDSPETIRQKEAARQTVLDGLKFSAGRAYEEYYGEPNVSPARGGKSTKREDPLGIR